MPAAAELSGDLKPARPLTAAEFAEMIGPLGPFGSAPRLAVGVSGGADSTCLALLAHDWAMLRGGDVLALIVDHGLRSESAAETAMTAGRMTDHGIEVHKMKLNLRAGPGLAERARDARLCALARACVEAGVAHLLLGHHASDQVETILLRALAGSGQAGLAGMAAVTHAAWGRIVRPFLSVPPARLRVTLSEAGIDWIDDPSNLDARATRPRLRLLRGDPGGGGPATRVLAEASLAEAARRAAAERTDADLLAAAVAIQPEGFCVLDPATLPASALAALIRAVGGAVHAPPLDRVRRLAAAPRGGTLGGARLVPGGRLAPGRWLLVREARRAGTPVAAVAGARWDERWQLGPCAAPLDAMVGALGADATRIRVEMGRVLPMAVMGALPAIRVGGEIVAVPPLGWPEASAARAWPVTFAPRRPAACAPFAYGTGASDTGRRDAGA